MNGKEIEKICIAKDRNEKVNATKYFIMQRLKLK